MNEMESKQENANQKNNENYKENGRSQDSKLSQVLSNIALSVWERPAVAWQISEMEKMLSEGTVSFGSTVSKLGDFKNQNISVV